MGTLADLKRKLIIGTPITLIYARQGLASNNKRLNLLRYVIKTQTNGIYLAEDKNATKGSFLELPKASLMDFTEGILSIYTTGLRDLTEEEKQIIANQPKDEEQSRIDMISDGSTMFYREKAYFKEKNAEYLFLGNSKVIMGLSFDSNNNKVRDETLKGDLDLKYKIG